MAHTHIMNDESPTPEQIRAARKAAGLTQAEAGQAIHATRRAWQAWELGTNRMHPAFWELFKIKTEDGIERIGGSALRMKSYAPLLDMLVHKVFESLSPRTSNTLRTDGIYYVGELVQRTENELLSIPNMGKKSINELKDAVAQHGLELGMHLPGWVSPDEYLPPSGS